MWMPVSCSRVLIVQATPRSVWLPSRLPRAKASLILKVVGEDIWPLPISHAGMFTHESRGIDITSTHFRSAAMCMIINVSDWSVTRFCPKPRMPLRRVRADDHDVLGLRVGVDRLGAEFAGDVDLMDVAVQVPVDGVGAAQGQPAPRPRPRRPSRPGSSSCGWVMAGGLGAAPGARRDRRRRATRPAPRVPGTHGTSPLLTRPAPGPRLPAHARGLDQARPCQRAPCVLTPYPDPVGARAVSTRDARPLRSVTPGCTNHPTRRNDVALRIVSPSTKYPPAGK